MAGARTMINGGSRQRVSRRPIPKRGQVKAGIVVGLTRSLSAIFSLNSTSSSGRLLSRKNTHTSQQSQTHF